MKFSLLPVMLAGLLASVSAHAIDLGLSADISSLGAGLHVAVPLQTDLNARIGFNAYNYSYSGSTSDVNYNFKFKLNSVDALLDWYPYSGTFRLTAGIIHNGNKVNSVATANVSGNYVINGNTYNSASAGMIDGDITFRNIAPYIGIGWGNSAGGSKGWGFTSDLGVVAQGSPNSTLTNSGCTGTAAMCAQLASDLAVENNTLEQKMNNYKLYPMVRLGLYYHF